MPRHPLAKSFRKTFAPRHAGRYICDIGTMRQSPLSQFALSLTGFQSSFPKRSIRRWPRHLIWVETARGVRVAGYSPLAESEPRWLLTREHPGSRESTEFAVDGNDRGFGRAIAAQALLNSLFEDRAEKRGAKDQYLTCSELGPKV